MPGTVAEVTLEGRYVRLEPLRLAHVPALCAVATASRETYRYTHVPSGEDEMRRYVEGALALRRASQALPFATVDRRRGEVKGATRFGNIEFWSWPPGNAPRRGAHLPDAVEIGWTWLAAAAQRTGLNTEAKLLMLTHAFEVWRVHRVRLMTDVRNAGSRGAVLRIGARLDGILRAHTVGADGTVRDSAAYSILDAEWPSVKAALTARLRRGRRIARVLPPGAPTRRRD